MFRKRSVTGSGGGVGGERDCQSLSLAWANTLVYYRFCALRIHNVFTVQAAEVLSKGFNPLSSRPPLVRDLAQCYKTFYDHYLRVFVQS
jgi:hypothetical protein